MIDTLVIKVDNKESNLIRKNFQINGLSKINKLSFFDTNYESCSNLNVFILVDKKYRKLIRYCLKNKKINIISTTKELIEKSSVNNILMVSDKYILNRNIVDNINCQFDGKFLYFKHNKNIVKDFVCFNKEFINKIFRKENLKNSKKINLTDKFATKINNVSDLIHYDPKFAENNDYLIYTPGPLNIRMVARPVLTNFAVHHRSEIAPYFYKELADNIKYIFGSTKGFPIAMMSTGLGCIESCFANLTQPNDEALILNNGFFGNNLVNNAKHYKLNYEVLKADIGKTFDLKDVEEKIQGKKFLFMTHLETSTGVLNDVEAIGKLCKKHNVMLIVDAVSSLINHEFHFDKWNVTAAVGTSTKGLEISPGLSILCLSEQAIEIMKANEINANDRSMYLSWKTFINKHLYNGVTPSTFPLGLIASFNAAMKEIKIKGIKQQYSFKKKISTILYEALENSGFERLPDKNNCASWIVVVKTPEHVSAKNLRAFLYINFNILIETGIMDETDRILRIGLPMYMSVKSLNDLKKHICKYPSLVK